MGAAILYFILAVASLAGAIVMICLQGEWWVTLTFFLLTVFLITMGVARIDEETDVISSFIRGLQKKKALKIYNGKFETKPLNMVPMFIQAHRERREFGKDAIKSKAVRAISGSFNEVIKNWHYAFDNTNEMKEALNDNRESVKKFLFETFELLMSLFLGSECRDDAYKAYTEICNRIGLVPTEKNKLIESSQNLIKENVDLAGLRVNFLKSVTRTSMKAASFEAMVQGFCYFALLNDTVHEEEYDVMKLYFFDRSLGDIYPDTGEQFKKEY